MAHYKHIIFDLDGTLTDTELAILKTWQQTLREYGYDFTLNALQSVLGITQDMALKKLNVKVDDDFDNRWLENYSLLGKDPQFFDGVQELLKRIKQSGRSVGLVTSRYKTELENYFSTLYLQDIFDCIVCADDTRLHKPHNEPIRKYMDTMQAVSNECIYIGDMVTDIMCANAANIDAGLALWNGKIIEHCNAQFYFSSTNELLRLLNC